MERGAAPEDDARALLHRPPQQHMLWCRATCHGRHRAQSRRVVISLHAGAAKNTVCDGLNSALVAPVRQQPQRERHPRVKLELDDVGWRHLRSKAVEMAVAAAGSVQACSLLSRLATQHRGGPER